MPELDPDVIFLADLDGIRVASWGPFFFNAWDALPSVTSVEQVGDEQERYFASHGSKLVVITFLNPRAGIKVEADVREAAPKVADRTAYTSAGMVTVVEQDGFFAATVRMVMNGLFLLRPAPYPTDVVSSRSAAAAFAQKVLGEAAPPAEAAVAAMDTFRARFGA